MSIDSSQPITQGPRPDWRLPNIVSIEARRIPYQPRRLRNFESVLSQYDQAVEFIVKTDGPIPARALGPALFVGEVQVAESEQLAENVYRFLGFELERLAVGAPVAWGWIGDPKERRQETEYRLDL
jgi:hypothetical protein